MAILMIADKNQVHRPRRWPKECSMWRQWQQLSSLQTQQPGHFLLP